MRRSAIESLQRGLTSLAANWELVLVHLAQTLVVSLLMVAGAIPFVLVIGLGTFRMLLASDFRASGPPSAVMDELMTTVAEATVPLLVSTVVACFVWTIAILVYSYFQAGIFGVLAEAERRAASPPVVRRSFRSFSATGFRSSADRGLWTFFWLINLFMLIGTLLLLVAGAVVLLAAWLGTRDGSGAAVAVGCFGGLVAALAAAVSALWWQLSMAAASGGLRLRRALGVGAAALVRRAGAVTVLALLAVVVGMMVAIAFVPAGIALEFAVSDSLSAYVTAQIVMTVVQSLISSVLSIAFAGTFIALVAGEICQGAVAAE